MDKSTTQYRFSEYEDRILVTSIPVKSRELKFKLKQELKLELRILRETMNKGTKVGAPSFMV